ncbi:MAG: hypothetical protein ACT4NL_02210 [Pseudomarimonas sp.]
MKSRQTFPRCNRLLAAGLALLLPLSATAGAEDWASPEAIVHALYDVISADAGEARDWDRYRALFFDSTRFAVAMDSKIASGIMVMTSEEMVAQTEAAYGSTGFHEKALVTKVEQHGLMASVMSSFEVRLRRDDAEPLMRGLNHFQLLNDGERWWIISNVGVIESESSPLPAEFATAANAPKVTP